VPANGTAEILDLWRSPESHDICPSRHRRGRAAPRPCAGESLSALRTDCVACSTSTTCCSGFGQQQPQPASVRTGGLHREHHPRSRCRGRAASRCAHSRLDRMPSCATRTSSTSQVICWRTGCWPASSTMSPNTAATTRSTRSRSARRPRTHPARGSRSPRRTRSDSSVC